MTAYGIGVSGTDSYKPAASGQYWWYASYAQDVPNATDSTPATTDSDCGVVVWVQVPVQRAPSLFGTGGGGTLSPFTFGSTVSSADDGELCYYPVSCNAATEPTAAEPAPADEPVEVTPIADEPAEVPPVAVAPKHHRRQHG